MGFGLESLASAVMGAVAEVAEAGIKIATEVADVIAAQADIANILEDGQIDEDEQDRLLDDINKLMVGAYLLGVGSYLAGVGSIKFGSESGSSKDCSVSSWDEDIDSLPEYDPISARITENKGTRAKKKGVNGEYFAGRIDEFGNFIPDDIQGFTNIEVKEVDESSLSHRALCVFEGIVGQAVNDLKDLKEAVIDHPFDTAISTIRLFGDPQYSGQAAVAIGTEIYKSYEDQVVNGNQKSKDHFIGQAIFEIGTLVAGTAAGKLGKISKVGEGVEAANDISKAGKMGKVEEAVEGGSKAESEISGGVCFTEETLVLTKDGHKHIKDIKIGDEVYSQNQYTGEKGLKKVTDIFVNETDRLVRITIKETEIKATPTHPFWVVDKGWVVAEELEVGDNVQLYSGEVIEITSLKFELIGEYIKVYNFEVEEWHTYYVSNRGILVHNTCSEYVPNNPKWVGAGTDMWTWAEENNYKLSFGGGTDIGKMFVSNSEGEVIGEIHSGQLIDRGVNAGKEVQIHFEYYFEGTTKTDDSLHLYFED